MNIRNIAIIAHVDHGKTTLVDAMLRQTDTKISKDLEAKGLIMDSNELERERGITIFSKNASIKYKSVKINIIDTPGHADFGGEVERVLSMADGALLLVDAKEGPMPQTRFVLREALKIGLKIIVVINKIDKKDIRINWAVNKIFDLFIELGADEETAFFPIIYASGRLGKASDSADLSKMKDITPLLDTIIKEIPAPLGNPGIPFQMRVSSISFDNFKGRIAIGKVFNGIIKNGSQVAYIDKSNCISSHRITSIATFIGLNKFEVDEASAGDIVAISGIPQITIGETIADLNNPKALPILKIEEPTVKMKFMVNNSPMGGKEGKFKTSSQIRARLLKELETDVALKVEESEGKWTVSGRGELHLAILIERMRREGYEFQVSTPDVITKTMGAKLFTPYEYVYIQVPQIYSGSVMSKMGQRHGQLKDMSKIETTIFLEFIIATKDLIGYRSEFTKDTKGLGIINSSFYNYLPDVEFTKKRERGSLVAHESGETRLYGLVNVQDRGELFIGPGVNVYKGQVVGQNSRSEDIRVNVCKQKELSNMRSKGDGTSEHFNAPRTLSLEEAMEYIDESELLEVTPKSIRIRKIILDEIEERKKRKHLV